MQDEDLRWCRAGGSGERVSYLETARGYWNGWLHPHEIEEIRAAVDEADAERLVRSVVERQRSRLADWRQFQ